MGRKTGSLSKESHISDSSSVREALLFTTMSIIGLPVEVQVNDGSIYSGILHTACFEKDYGIVLKKAKMCKKGKKDANLANGDIVDTLVVHSGDLVQIVAKGYLLPADEIVGSVCNEDIEAVSGSLLPLENSESEITKMKCGKDAPKSLIRDTNQIRSSDHIVNKLDYGYGLAKDGVDLPSRGEKGQKKEIAAVLLGGAKETENGKDGIHSTKVEEASIGPLVSVDEGQVGKDKALKKKTVGAHKDDTIHEFHYSSSNANASIPQLKSVNGLQVDISLRISSSGPACGGTVPSLAKHNTQDYERPTSVGSSSPNLPASDLPSSLTTTVNMSSQSFTVASASQTVSIAPKGPVSNMSGKEFKLNPGAKTFLPTFSIPKSTPPPTATAVASMTYVPNTPVVPLPVAVAPQEIGISPFAPRSSLPVKFVPQYNLIVNGDGTSQYSQPVVGHVGNRPQPVRYGNQYNPVQAGLAYVQPNSQPVMVGRMGQFVYVPPISHDMLHASAIPSQISARPQLTTQVHLPKHQGSAAAAAQALHGCVTQQPYVATGQQSFAMASHLPYSQSAYPVLRPVQGPGSNAYFGNKFL